MDKNECEDKYSEPETLEHINGKRDIYEWIKKQDGVKNAILEEWIPETKQRPDIMFEYNNIKCVIEYQCTPISSEYIERHELYQAIGIHDIWICGTEKYISAGKRINTLEGIACIYYDCKNKYLYDVEDLTEKEIKNISNMCDLRENLTTRYRCKKYYNREFHVMKNVYDYLDGYKNFIHIKDNSNNYYCTGSFYPSPTGRPSNKYPYPVRRYAFSRNYSYATCYKLSNTKLKNIGDDKKYE